MVFGGRLMFPPLLGGHCAVCRKYPEEVYKGDGL